ncbi:dipeptidase PepV [Mycoplasmatota bacterium]|nr:dipeptidase PepV [Mycoplasmatota bacterium]
MNWLDIAKNYEDEYIRIVKEVLKIPTVLKKYTPENKEAPFGDDIRKSLDYMLDLGVKDGFKVKNIDNYAGHIEIGDGEEVLGVLGHLDVVPAGGKWNNPPFSAFEEDGKIYARGAMDDKGPTIAAYIALKMIKDQGIKLNKKVRLILGCDEESGMRGIKRYLEKEQMPDLGFAPDAEFPLIYAEKGIYAFTYNGNVTDKLLLSLESGDRFNVVPDQCVAKLSENREKEFMKFLKDHKLQGEIKGDEYIVYGKNAHAAWPHLGVNAISLMVKFLVKQTNNPFINMLNKYLTDDHLGKKLDINIHDKEMDDLTLNLAFVHYDGKSVEIGVNIRYPKNYNFDEGEKKIIKSGKEFALNYMIDSNSKPHYVSPEDELVKALHESYIKYTNDTESKIMSIGGGTYSRMLKKAVAFGPALPGDEDLAHQPNEYLNIKDMMNAVAIYAEGIVRLAGE